MVWPSLEQSRLTDVGCRRQLSVRGSGRWQEDVSGRIGLGRPWCCSVHHRNLQHGHGIDMQGVTKEKPEVVELYN